MKAIHTITHRKLLALQKDGFLTGNTPFYQDEEDKRNYCKLTPEFKHAPSLKYICAIPKSRIASWKRSGFMKEIEFFIKPDYVLEFEIPIICFKFVREHNFTSPVEIKTKFGLDQFMKVKEPYLTRIWMKYLKSNKVFKRTNDLNGIKVPELWINASIPLKKVKITTFSAFKRKYKF